MSNPVLPSLILRGLTLNVRIPARFALVVEGTWNVVLPAHDGFVKRYESDSSVDGLPPGEGAFLACSFWLADNYVLMGRENEGQATFERLLGLCNDVGLLSEEYDPHAKRLVGSFPQAFSHVGLINAAMNLVRAQGPTHKRRQT
jgi:GH15 family glucan-1,4-alpha-glucosidase